MLPPRALLLVLLVASTAAGSESFREKLIDPEDGQLDASRYLSEVPLGFLPVPTIITEPAVGFGVALGAVFFHESAEQRKQRTNQGVLLPENISILGGGATENGTWAGGAGHLGFWRQDSVRYRGFVGFGSINLDFFSIPGVGELPRPIELELEGPAVFQDIKFRLPDTQFFVGARQLYRSVESNFANERDGGLLPPEIVENLEDQHGRSIITSGVGVLIEYDSRDNPFNPQSGYYFATNYTWFDGTIGSNVDYHSFNVTALNYWSLHEKFNLGIRLQLDGVGDANGDRLPAYVPPFIKLRGVSASRYQGNRVVVAEAQLDYQLNKRWKFGVFTGIGRAADELDELGGAEHVYNFGTGFRYLIARRYGFVMGLDVARGPDDTAVYIQAGSTW